MLRPTPYEGQYWRTREHETIRCKAYSGPPSARGGCGGDYICTIEPGTTLGPVETWLSTCAFLTILVRGYWINVWSGANRCYFAHSVPWHEVQAWRARGWVD